MELTTADKQAFNHDGVLPLPGFYPDDVVSRMADGVWANLGRRYQVKRDQKEPWPTVRPAGFQSLSRSGALQEAVPPALGALASELAGGVWRAGGHPVPLVTFPTGEWHVPSAGWHVDTPAAPDQVLVESLGTLRLFVLLGAVAPRAGGTLYVAGAHRLLLNLASEAKCPISSAKARDHLKAASPWFDVLFSNDTAERSQHLNEGTTVRDVSVAVREMTGQPGDLLVMHPNMLHAVAPNESDCPRIALTVTMIRGL